LPLVETHVLTAATTATGTFGPVTPTEENPDHRVALSVTVSVTSGSPSLIFKLQGQVDGTYVDILLLPNDTDTAAATFTKAALGTFVYFVAQSHTRKFESFQLVVGTATTVTYNANLNVLI
jgi:hypothetical protein